MNENIDLTKILKDCPKGEKFYSPLFGDIEFNKIDKKANMVVVGEDWELNSDGTITLEDKSPEIILYPSREQRDWSKFTAPWYKKEKFDPKTLKPFNRILVRDYCNAVWECNIFSHICNNIEYPYHCIGNSVRYCIPYNDVTKHLVGTKDEAPEYYRYWED